MSLINRPKSRGLIRIAVIRGVDVYAHWSVFLIAVVALTGALREPIVTVVGLASYLGVLLVHECGHLIAAQRKSCRVLSIELYPIWGLTRFESPRTRIDAGVIAWAGVLAQAVFAAPLVAWVAVFGYTRFEAANAALALLGFFSLGVAAFNLIPVSPLDGATAWRLVPALFQNARARRKHRKRVDLIVRRRLDEIFSRGRRK